MRLISVGLALLLGAGLLIATPAPAVAGSDDELTSSEATGGMVSA
ncbi:MAG TPA: hypothetical protein VLG28_10400 [Acidimicrobiia bacterium]|nr:hypothetical protein [Acidimicrobiia bacterium]